jgi:hypothetical protein
MNTTDKRFFTLIAVLTGLIGLYIYNPFHLYFLADDFLHIPESANNLWMQRNSLRPVGNFSLHIDYLISSKNALGYHVTNLLLHLVNAVLISITAKIIFKKYTEITSDWLPYLIGLFFFTYPFHSESVFWIIGRSGSLGCLFFLAALLGFLQREKSILYTVASFVFFELALLSYESSWIFPLVILLFIVADIQSSTINKKKQFGYLFLIILQFSLHLYIRFSATGELMNQYDAASFVHFDFHVLIENYIRLFARTVVPPLFNNHYFLSFFSVVFLAITLLIFSLYRQKKINLFFLCLTAMWLFSYLPYLSLGIDTHGVEGERYLYLPSVFFIIWILYLVHQLFQTKQFLVIVFVLTGANLFYLQQSRNYYVKAGKITTETVLQISNQANKKRIFFNNLPQYNKGAVVFRIGLEDAAKWLGNNQQIIVVSKDSSDEKPAPYHYKKFKTYFVNDNYAKPVSSILTKDNSFKKNYIAKETAGLFFYPSTDAMFTYNDTALIINR